MCEVGYVYINILVAELIRFVLTSIEKPVFFTVALDAL